MFLPEYEMAVRAKGSTPFEIRTNDKKYPLKDILRAADLVGGGSEVLSRQTDLLDHPDDIVKYWALIGLISHGTAASGVVEKVAPLLGCSTPNTRIAAATVLLSLGKHRGEAGNVLKKELLKTTGPNAYTVMAALEALRYLKDKAPDCTRELTQAYTNHKGRDTASSYIRDGIRSSGLLPEEPASGRQ